MLNLDPEKLFTIKGAVTVDKRYQFAGREELIAKCLEDLSSEGSVTVIFGERGVGKTSLAWQLVGPLTGSRQILQERQIRPRISVNKEFSCIWCTCNSLMHSITDLLYTLVKDDEPRFTLRRAFPNVFAPKQVDKVVRSYKFGLPIAGAQVKFEPSKANDPTRAISASNEELAAFSAFKHLLERARREYSDRGDLVIFLDEFDQLQDRARVGLLLKSINNVRFVIIGVAATRAALIGQHPSVGRKLTAYEVPLFTEDNVNWFFDSVEERSGQQLLFTGDFRKHIYRKSSGFPWLVQQLGFYSVRDAIHSAGASRAGGRITVGVENYRAMVRDFIRAKLGGEDFDVAILKSAERRLLLALSETSNGRLSEDDLLERLPPSLRAYYDEALEALIAAGLVYKQQRQIRITDPLTKILIERASEEGLLED